MTAVEFLGEELEIGDEEVVVGIVYDTDSSKVRKVMEGPDELPAADVAVMAEELRWAADIFSSNYRQREADVVSEVVDERLSTGSRGMYQ